MTAGAQPTGPPETRTGQVGVIDRRSAEPLYHQLYVDLRRRLLSGEWKAGDPFPKDTDIEAAYGVSRITVRQALSMLVDGNFVVRYRGRGSFVGNLPTGRTRQNHLTVRGEIEASGRAHTEKLLGLETHVTSDHSARQLGISEDEQLIILKRLHLADDEPVCIEHVMVGAGKYPDLFDRVVRQEETLAQAYRRHDIDVVKSDQIVSAVIPSSEKAAQLSLAKNNPVLFVERVGYSRKNLPLEVRRLHYRADLFALHQEIVWGSAETRIPPAVSTDGDVNRRVSDELDQISQKV